MKQISNPDHPKRAVFALLLLTIFMIFSCSSSSGDSDDDTQPTDSDGNTIPDTNQPDTATSTAWQVYTDSLGIITPGGYDIAFHNNTFYLAMGDRGNGQKATVMTFDGSAWETLGAAGFSDNATQSMTVTVDTVTGLPYVVFQANCSECLINFHGSVMGYNGTGWYYLGDPGFTTSQTYFLSLAVRDNHEYLVVTPNSAYFGHPSLQLYDSGSKEWSAMGETFLDDFDLAYPDGVDLVATDDTLYLAFRTTDKRINVVSQTLAPNAIETVGDTGFSTPSQSAADLVVSGNTLYVAYSEDVTANVVVMMYNGSSWQVLGDTGKAALYRPTLLIYKETPYVAFIDLDRQLHVLRYENDSWSSVDPNGLATSTALTLMPTLGLFADNDILYLAYLIEDETGGNTTYGNMKVIIKTIDLTDL